MRTHLGGLAYALLLVGGIALLAEASTTRTTKGSERQLCFRVDKITFTLETNKDTDDLQSWSTKVYRDDQTGLTQIGGTSDDTGLLNSDQGSYYGFDGEWRPEGGWADSMLQGSDYYIEVTSTWSDDGFPVGIYDIVVHCRDASWTTDVDPTEPGTYPVTYKLRNDDDDDIAVTFNVFTAAEPCTAVAGMPPPCPDPGTDHGGFFETWLAPGDSVEYAVDGGTDEYLHVEGYLLGAWDPADTVLISESWYAPSAVPVPVKLPAEDFSLRAVMPNPARGPAQVAFALPRDSDVLLRVVDVAGREVATLADRRMPPGEHHIVWDGRGAGGRSASGTYFVRLEVDGRMAARRMVLLR